MLLEARAALIRLRRARTVLADGQRSAQCECPQRRDQPDALFSRLQAGEEREGERELADLHATKPKKKHKENRNVRASANGLTAIRGLARHGVSRGCDPAVVA